MGGATCTTKYNLNLECTPIAGNVPKLDKLCDLFPFDVQNLGKVQIMLTLCSFIVHNRCTSVMWAFGSFFIVSNFYRLDLQTKKKRKEKKINKNLCCISKSTMKHIQNRTYPNLVMIIGSVCFDFLTRYIGPPNIVHC